MRASVDSFRSRTEIDINQSSCRSVRRLDHRAERRCDDAGFHLTAMKQYSPETIDNLDSPKLIFPVVTPVDAEQLNIRRCRPYGFVFTDE